MSKTFTDEERDAINAETYATLDRTAEIAAKRKIALLPIETRNQRHIREIAEQDARFEAERAAERKREARERRAIFNNQRIDELESQVLEIVKCTITACEGLEYELARVTRENADLKLKQAQLEITMAELRLALAERTGKVIEHPLRAVN
jgi:hypothetical protein